MKSPTVRKVFRQMEEITLNDALSIKIRRAADKVLEELLKAMRPVAPNKSTLSERTWHGVQCRRREALIDEYNAIHKQAQDLRKKNQNNRGAWRLGRLNRPICLDHFLDLPN
jgi:hypothetical protein